MLQSDGRPLDLYFHPTLHSWMMMVTQFSYQLFVSWRKKVMRFHRYVILFVSYRWCAGPLGVCVCPVVWTCVPPMSLHTNRTPPPDPKYSACARQCWWNFPFFYLDIFLISNCNGSAGVNSVFFFFFWGMFLILFRDQGSPWMDAFVVAVLSPQFVFRAWLDLICPRLWGGTFLLGMRNLEYCTTGLCHNEMAFIFLFV